MHVIFAVLVVLSPVVIKLLWEFLILIIIIMIAFVKRTVNGSQMRYMVALA